MATETSAQTEQVGQSAGQADPDGWGGDQGSGVSRGMKVTTIAAAIVLDILTYLAGIVPHAPGTRGAGGAVWGFLMITLIWVAASAGVFYLVRYHHQEIRTHGARAGRWAGGQGRKGWNWFRTRQGRRMLADQRQDQADWDALVNTEGDGSVFSCAQMEMAVRRTWGLTDAEIELRKRQVNNTFYLLMPFALTHPLILAGRTGQAEKALSMYLSHMEQETIPVRITFVHRYHPDWVVVHIAAPATGSESLQVIATPDTASAAAGAAPSAPSSAASRAAASGDEWTFTAGQIADAIRGAWHSAEHRVEVRRTSTVDVFEVTVLAAVLGADGSSADYVRAGEALSRVLKAPVRIFAVKDRTDWTLFGLAAPAGASAPAKPSRKERPPVVTATNDTAAPPQRGGRKAANRIGNVQARWRQLITENDDFLPVQDTELHQHVLDDSAGLHDWAQSYSDLHERLLAPGTKLPADSIRKLAEFSELLTDVAEACAEISTTFEQYYEVVSDDVAGGTELPEHGEFISGEGSGD